MNANPLIIIAVALAALVGGLGLFTFSHAKGWSYLSTDPNACVNCHIMRPQFASWQHSSHKNVATCQDCHMPHDFVGKWYTKARAGWNHSKAFTTGNFHEPIQITPIDKQIALNNCVACHQNLVGDMHTTVSGHNSNFTTVRREKAQDAPTCTSCHGNVGHQGNK